MDREAILICLATFNEMENLPALVAQVFQVLPAAHILVIDDASPDGTGDWCEHYTESDSRLSVVRRPARLGLGSAHLETMNWAIRNQYAWLITMDADGSHDPRHLPAMLARASAGPPCDVVIGSRYIPGGSIHDWPWRRRVASRWVNGFARWSLQLPTADCSSAYRCYRVARLRQLPVGCIQATGYAFLEESLWQLSRRGFRLAEIPIAFVDRRQGASKADWKAACRAGCCLLRLALVAQFTGTRRRHPSPES